MSERSDGMGHPGGGAPAVPSARVATEGPERDRTVAAGTPGHASGHPPGRPPGDRPGWRERGWDIPWLGGRTTAPWVVLATVLILAVAIAGTFYAKQRPDRLGWTTETVTVTSDSAVTFRFNVFKAPKAVAACDIVAADQGGGVGVLRDIPIPARADGQQNNDITVVVPTSRRADTALLETCRIVHPG